VTAEPRDERRDAIHRATALLRAACGAAVRTSVPLAPLTSLRIGGPAAIYLEARSEQDLTAASATVAETGIPVIAIGKGSNVLVSDAGFPGLVLRLGRGFRWAARDGARVAAGAAMPLPAFAGMALGHRLAGLEFGVAIPGSLGGAVRMNAGAHEREMADVVERVDVFDLTAGRSVRLTRDEIGFGYRTSALPDGGIVVAATARLAEDEPDAIRRRMDAAREWRRRTQPLAEPNCGSVFKNPPGDRAARLIEECGGKRLSVGGVSVSSKHANFVVSEPGARSSDVVELVRRVQELVSARAGVVLETEVHLVGNFDLVPH
jgi:UDP-N-acetylmuramate dehydrogenase